DTAAVSRIAECCSVNRILRIIGGIMAIPWLALAFLGGSVLQANEARKARKAASEQQIASLKQQALDAEKMREAIDAQTAAYAKTGASLESQAETARMAFEASQAQYQENKLAMERQAAEVQKMAEEERRKAAASEQSALRARTRGGRRSLLSQERLTPELGVQYQTLGVGMQ
ncbi:MAG: hypothetical protein ACO3GP_09580, partial [Candidatus Limnocylindrus sp.]